MARNTKPAVVEIPEQFVVGAETGYAVRSHIIDTTAAVKECSSNAFQKTKGFVFGLIGPRKPKEPKVREVRMTPELQAWLASRAK